MKLILFSCLLFGLLLSTTSHAQTACPPGMEEYGAGVCGCSQSEEPAQQIPQQQLPQPPATRWASRWGAIATDGPGGSFGSAVDKSSRRGAESAAISDCLSKRGSPNCKIEVSYANGCGVMTVGDKMHNSNYGSTVEEATQKGMAMCRSAGDTNCHVYYSACSLPVRIQ